MDVSRRGVTRLAMRAASRLVNPGGRPSPERLQRAVDGKVVLVTGASHGIGRATATKLADAGASVLLVARSGDVLDELAEELRERGADAQAFPVDLTDTDRVGELVPELLAAHGRVDIVVNNAGKSIRRSVAATADRFHDVTRTIGVNYLGPVRLLLGLLPAMREQGGGHIVNTSTIGVLVPPAPRWSAYQASKTAFDVWLRSAVAETERDGVTATSVYLALVHTRMSAPTDDFNLVPGMRAEQAADVLCHAIVERPASIAPWWASAANVIDGAARGPSQAIARHYGRTVPSGERPIRS
jgi:NAD(P)-dependent dehydrogenase (short-subunit alcohol dehydrogenase family)